MLENIEKNPVAMGAITCVVASLILPLAGSIVIGILAYYMSKKKNDKKGD